MLQTLEIAYLWIKADTNSAWKSTFIGYIEPTKNI